MNPMNMKNTILYLSLAALVLAGCAKDPNTGVNDANQLYLDAWIHVNHPDAVRTALGAYILEDIPGTGPSVSSAESYPYVRVDYTIRKLDGSVQTTTEEALAKRLGTYTANQSKNPYYGPLVWNRSSDGLVAGLEEAVSTMSVGGHRSVVLPGWLMGVDASTNASLRYKTAEEYLEKVPGGTPVIYDITLTEAFSDAVKWQIDSVGRYLAKSFPGKTAADSTKKGFYYFRTGAPSSETKFKNDTTIYINGRAGVRYQHRGYRQILRHLFRIPDLRGLQDQLVFFRQGLHQHHHDHARGFEFFQRDQRLLPGPRPDAPAREGFSHLRLGLGLREQRIGYRHSGLFPAALRFRNRRQTCRVKHDSRRCSSDRTRNRENR